MKPDFDSPVVLANTARVLRSEVLPAVQDDEARLALIRIIAVIESHLAQLAAVDPGSTDGTPRPAVQAALDGTMLMAFGGRLADERDDGSSSST